MAWGSLDGVHFEPHRRVTVRKAPRQCLLGVAVATSLATILSVFYKFEIHSHIDALSPAEFESLTSVRVTAEPEEGRDDTPTPVPLPPTPGAPAPKLMRTDPASGLLQSLAVVSPHAPETPAQSSYDEELQLELGIDQRSNHHAEFNQLARVSSGSAPSKALKESKVATQLQHSDNEFYKLPRWATQERTTTLQEQRTNPPYGQAEMESEGTTMPGVTPAPAPASTDVPTHSPTMTPTDTPTAGPTSTLHEEANATPLPVLPAPPAAKKTKVDVDESAVEKAVEKALNKVLTSSPTTVPSVSVQSTATPLDAAEKQAEKAIDKAVNSLTDTPTDASMATLAPAPVSLTSSPSNPPTQPAQAINTAAKNKPQGIQGEDTVVVLPIG